MKIAIVGGAVCTAALLAGCFTVGTVTRLDLGTRFIHVRDTNAEGPNTFESFTQTLIVADDPNTEIDETRWGPLEPSMVANTSGVASSIFQSAGYVWGQSARRPDNVNISQTGGGANSESNSEASGEASASARVKNTTRVDVDVKVRQNQKQGQKQGQKQAQKQGQRQGQKQGQLQAQKNGGGKKKR